MQYIAQRVEDAEQVFDCGECKRSRVDSSGSIEEVVTPLLQISEDVRALDVNLHYLFVDGVGEVLSSLSHTDTQGQYAKHTYHKRFYHARQ